jgi:hypothetical protein
MADTMAGHRIRDPHDLHARIDVQLDQAAHEVARRLDGRIDYDAAREAVTRAYADLARSARVRNFLPILAARPAQRTLEQAAAG